MRSNCKASHLLLVCLTLILQPLVLLLVRMDLMLFAQLHPPLAQ